MVTFEDLRSVYSNYSEGTDIRNPDTWQCLLDILNNEGWSAYEYLDFVFKEYKRPMVPSLLCSEKASDKYRTVKADRVARNKEKFEWAMQQVSNRLEEDYTLDEILDDLALESYALLRYLIAATGKNTERMDQLRKAALYEIRTMPEIVEIYTTRFSRRLLPC